MYERILFPTDGSEAADAAMDMAVAVANAHGATLHVLYVADTNRASLARIEDEVADVLVREGERVVEAAGERAEGAGVETKTAVLQGDPSQTILDYATELGIDAVVMGTEGERNVERILLGSVTERVVRRSPVPVFAVPPEAAVDYPPDDVLVGTDGSEGSDAAVEEALAVAGAGSGTLHAVSVVEQTLLGLDVRSASAAEERERRDERVLATVRERATDAGVAVEASVEEGGVVDVLNEYAADHGADLIAVGTHGRTGIDRRLLGSVTEDLLRTADVPVLSVRAAADE